MKILQKIKRFPLTTILTIFYFFPLLNLLLMALSLSGGFNLLDETNETMIYLTIFSPIALLLAALFILFSFLPLLPQIVAVLLFSYLLFLFLDWLIFLAVSKFFVEKKSSALGQKEEV